MNPWTTAEEIIEEVSTSTGISVEVLTRSRTRGTKHVAEARQKAMCKIRRATDLSTPEIGGLFNRDHTTVLHALRKEQS